MRTALRAWQVPPGSPIFERKPWSSRCPKLLPLATPGAPGSEAALAMADRPFPGRVPRDAAVPAPKGTRATIELPP